MGFFYCDESIRERGGFIVGAIVFSQTELSPIVFESLKQVGLKPRIDEFKSSMLMKSDPIQQELRDIIKSLLAKFCKIGLIITPVENRAKLGDEFLTAIKQILRMRVFPEDHVAHFDEQILFSKDCVEHFNAEFPKCIVQPEQDSKIVAGIQVADLAAHSFGTMLLETLGLIQKKISVGEGWGYEPTTEVSIGFELWATLRHLFFVSSTAHGTEEDSQLEMATFDVEGYGLLVSELCDERLRNAAIRRFGTTYLGCIH